MSDHGTETFRPLKKRSNKKPVDLTREQQAELAYPMWRWDMWIAGKGSYETIERKVRQGKLVPFECDCSKTDCPWKHKTTEG